MNESLNELIYLFTVTENIFQCVYCIFCCLVFEPFSSSAFNLL